MRPRGTFYSISAISLLVLCVAVTHAVAKQQLRVGVTLHPYYAWTRTIVGERAEVIPLLPADVDPHSYQPRPEDITRLIGLDALVMNGKGHDAFLEPMLLAAGQSDLVRIDLHRNVPLLSQAASARDAARRGYNCHSFLSITSAVHQINNLLDELVRLDPENAAWYRENGRKYKKRLRQRLAAALQELAATDYQAVKIGTVHDGYTYLLQDLGLEVHAVVQPRHGIRPSAKQLADTIKRLNESSINILFSEMDYEQRYVELIREETGVHISRLSHLSKGAYTAESYETQMSVNLRQVVDALRTVR